MQKEKGDRVYNNREKKGFGSVCISIVCICEGGTDKQTERRRFAGKREDNNAN